MFAKRATPPWARELLKIQREDEAAAAGGSPGSLDSAATHEGKLRSINRQRQITQSQAEFNEDSDDSDDDENGGGSDDDENGGGSDDDENGGGSDDDRKMAATNGTVDGDGSDDDEAEAAPTDRVPPVANDVRNAPLQNGVAALAVQNGPSQNGVAAGVAGVAAAGGNDDADIIRAQIAALQQRLPGAVASAGDDVPESFEPMWHPEERRQSGLAQFVYPLEPVLDQDGNFVSEHPALWPHVAEFIREVEAGAYPEHFRNTTARQSVQKSLPALCLLRHFSKSGPGFRVTRNAKFRRGFWNKWSQEQMAQANLFLRQSLGLSRPAIDYVFHEGNPAQFWQNVPTNGNAKLVQFMNRVMGYRIG
ncbi:MAG: hypothetical protein SGARI_001458 [Bacillariaceae sp.]